MKYDQPILTLDARDSVFLEVMADYSALTDLQVRREIVGAHKELLRVLAAKGIDYQSLKAGLVPSADRLERGFVFDTPLIESNWYGYDVAQVLLPLVNRRTTCSFLLGDLIHKNQDRAFEVLQHSLRLHKPCEVADTSQLYCIYINNLSQRMVETLHEGLKAYDPYVGFIDVTFSSPMKNWLSVTLVNGYVKRGTTFVGSHEDDLPNEEDYNLPGWPLERYNYDCRSIQATYFSLFLSYKIERAVFAGFESDTRFALAAISDHPRELSEFSVVLEQAKADYLRSEKSGSLRRAGLETLTPTELEAMIKSKVNDNYIYNLRFQHGVSLFNIVLEIRHPSDDRISKLTAAIEYQPDKRVLRVVTFF